MAEPRDLDVPGRLAQELGVDAERLAGLDSELLAAVDRRLRDLSEAAASDELTGALRRTAGVAALEREVRRAHRYGDSRLVVVFLDGVGLKAVNDEQGHAAGDVQIRGLADALRRRLRASDLLIRWGGDEFVCALPQAGREGAERVLSDVAADLDARSGVGFRAGLAELQPSDDSETLVARADSDLRRLRDLDRFGDSRQNRQGSSLHSLA